MRGLLPLSAVLVALPYSVHAAESLPFHTSVFPGDVSVALTLRSVIASQSVDYDYEVTIGLAERTSDGRTLFIDQGGHAAKVKCMPGKVFVGGRDYTPLPSEATRDWKEDLLESVCQSPVS
ncbi:hypothetical protein ATY75_21140 [Rhizobium sp. N122]|uniref:hypothetical protein n=1 Tax=Rhizobium sp. N122 TaxID=1764272 RepID=UPI000B5A88E9|nr:hypothetical protein [Rhizobium sp. N122]OWV87871.1 hypothetical protein ATY75_21140 [Rhizobium sp. N122]